MRVLLWSGRHPKIKEERDHSENDQRQGDGEPDLDPFEKRFTKSGSAPGDVRQFNLGSFPGSCFKAAPLLAEFSARVIHRAEGTAQFSRQLPRVPALGIDGF